MSEQQNANGNGLTRSLVLRVAAASLGINASFCLAFSLWVTAKIDTTTAETYRGANRITKLEGGLSALEERVRDVKSDVADRLMKIEAAVMKVSDKLDLALQKAHP